MKNITCLSLALASTLAITLFTASSCGSDLEIADLFIEMRITPGGEAYDASTVYDINGTKVTLDLVRVYISGVGLRTADGITAMTSEVLLINPGETLYQAGQVLAGDYNSAIFNVGLPEDINAADQSQYPIGNVLGPQSPSLYWNWDLGYIFVRLDGTYDTDGDDVPDFPWEVHLGTDQFLSPVEMSGSYSAEADGELTLAMKFDPLALFDGIDFPTENTTHVGDNLPMAQAVFDNMSSAFSAQ